MEPINELLIYDGHRPRDSVCRVELFDLPDERVAVIVEALDGNPGRRVTECWDFVLLEVKRTYGIDARWAVWIAVDRERSGSALRHQLVTFARGDEGKGVPKYAPMTTADWRMLGLTPRS